MCNRVKELLTSRINEILQNLGPPNPLMEEVTRHALFCRDHIHSFQGRADILQAIRNYVTGPDPMMPLVIYGESGVGKTSLMAKVVTEIKENSKDGNLAVICWFCGTTPDSSTGIAKFVELLLSLLLFFSILATPLAVLLNFKPEWYPPLASTQFNIYSYCL